MSILVNPWLVSTPRGPGGRHPTKRDLLAISNTTYPSQTNDGGCGCIGVDESVWTADRHRVQESRPWFESAESIGKRGRGRQSGQVLISNSQ